MARRALAPTGAYTLDQAAEQLGVSRRTVNRLVADGVLPVARVGHRTVRVRRDAIDEALQRLEQGTASETRKRFAPVSTARRGENQVRHGAGKARNT